MFEFDKSHRLITKKDYAQVFAQAKKIVTNEFVVLYTENTLDHARLGLAISKKIVAKAHNRNRLKRLLRETFRKAALPSLDIVFLARSGVEKKNHVTIYKTLDNLWSRLAN